MGNSESPEVRWGDWITEGWRMFTEQWKAWVLHSAAFAGLALVLFGPFFVGFLMLGSLASHPAPNDFPVFLFPLFFIVWIVFVAISVVFTTGFYKSALKQLRGGKLEFRDLFSGLDCFLPVLGAVFLVGLIQGIGVMMCIIPGLIASGLLMFTLPLVIDKRMGVIDAMKASYEKTKGNLVMFTLFALVVGLIAQAGSYACYVGLLATYPLHYTIATIAYRDLFGVEGARSFLPPPQHAQPAYSLPASPAEQQARTSENLSCTHCGASVPPTALFCPRCGNRVSGYSS
jgi:hypothetical protein